MLIQLGVEVVCVGQPRAGRSGHNFGRAVRHDEGQVRARGHNAEPRRFHPLQFLRQQKENSGQDHTPFNA